MNDIRTTRTTPGFLAGRLLGLLDLAKHDILGDTDMRYPRIYETVDLHPKTGIIALVKEWQAVQRRLESDARWADLDADWTWVMAHLDVDALAAMSRVDRGAEIIYGHALEKVHSAGRLTADARKTADEWVARAKSTAVGAVKAGLSESEAARMAGLNRLTVRSALGK